MRAALVVLPSAVLIVEAPHRSSLPSRRVALQMPAAPTRMPKTILPSPIKKNVRCTRASIPQTGSSTRVSTCTERACLSSSARGAGHGTGHRHRTICQPERRDRRGHPPPRSVRARRHQRRRVDPRARGLALAARGRDGAQALRADEPVQRGVRGAASRDHRTAGASRRPSAKSARPSPSASKSTPPAPPVIAPPPVAPPPVQMPSYAVQIGLEEVALPIAPPPIVPSVDRRGTRADRCIRTRVCAGALDRARAFDDGDRADAVRRGGSEAAAQRRDDGAARVRRPRRPRCCPSSPCRRACRPRRRRHPRRATPLSARERAFGEQGHRRSRGRSP